MSNYQERLREEIERVGITTLSKKLGIARNTLYNWSEKSNVPLDKLMAMGEHGLDVDYVISGNINPNVQYSEQDKKLINTIQKLTPENKEAAEKVIEGLSFVNNGYVKQVNINHNHSQAGFTDIEFSLVGAVFGILAIILATFGEKFIHSLPLGSLMMGMGGFVCLAFAVIFFILSHTTSHKFVPKKRRLSNVVEKEVITS